MKQTAGSKQHQRSAVNLALLRVDFEKIGTKVRWVPPARMPVDIMTKSDVAREKRSVVGSSAFWPVGRAGKSKPGRSNVASQRELLGIWNVTHVYQIFIVGSCDTT